MAREFESYRNGLYEDIAPSSLMEAYARTVDALTELMADRQSKYGHGNISAFGLQGIIIRAHDKLQRLRTMVFEGKSDADESIIDSLADLANYAVIGILFARGEWELPFIESDGAATPYDDYVDDECSEHCPCGGCSDQGNVVYATEEDAAKSYVTVKNGDILRFASAPFLAATSSEVTERADGSDGALLRIAREQVHWAEGLNKALSANSARMQEDNQHMKDILAGLRAAKDAALPMTAPDE